MLKKSSRYSVKIDFAYSSLSVFGSFLDKTGQYESYLQLNKGDRSAS